MQSRNIFTWTQLSFHKLNSLLDQDREHSSSPRTPLSSPPPHRQNPELSHQVLVLQVGVEEGITSTQEVLGSIPSTTETRYSGVPCIHLGSRGRRVNSSCLHSQFKANLGYGRSYLKKRGKKKAESLALLLLLSASTTFPSLWGSSLAQHAVPTGSAPLPFFSFL